jgi:hypothetical protein
MSSYASEGANFGMFIGSYDIMRKAASSKVSRKAGSGNPKLLPTVIALPKIWLQYF